MRNWSRLLVLLVLVFGGLFLMASVAGAATSYTVQPGDSLFFIGQRYGVSIADLKAANGLWDDLIYPGQVLSIPGSSGNGGNAGVANRYTVQPGDSLFFIGQRYGVSVTDLKAANGLWDDLIYPGEVLTIPGNSSSETTYTVQPGDSLFFIGQRYGVSVADLKAANGLWDDLIHPGQALKIPSGRITPAPTPTPSRGGTRGGGLPYTNYDLDLLAHLVYSEARGEIYEGQVAVAGVVLNRVKSRQFPNTIEGVIFEPWASPATHAGQFWYEPDSTAWQAAQDALNGWDPSEGALYYWNPVTATSPWIWTRTITKQIGNHVFGF